MTVKMCRMHSEVSAVSLSPKPTASLSPQWLRVELCPLRKVKLTTPKQKRWTLNSIYNIPNSPVLGSTGILKDDAIRSHDYHLNARGVAWAAPPCSVHASLPGKAALRQWRGLRGGLVQVLKFSQEGLEASPGLHGFSALEDRPEPMSQIHKS